MSQLQIQELDALNKSVGREIVRTAVAIVGVLNAAAFIRYGRLDCLEA